MESVETDPSLMFPCFSALGTEESVPNCPVTTAVAERTVSLPSPRNLTTVEDLALTVLPKAAPGISVEAEIALSPTQARTFLGCSARWWFKYGLSLPEPKTSSLAFGLAVHRALEINFLQKLESKENLETAGMVTIFRDCWMEQVGQTVFRDDENPRVLEKTGERLIAKYMDEVAPLVEPAAVEMDVRGVIGGVPVRGRIDLIDVHGRLVDIKTASRRPSCVPWDYAFQLATYRQITPGASGEARLDTLVKTNTPQLVQQSYEVGESDLRATQVLYPLIQESIRNGLYLPNRDSMMCSRRHCAFWVHCQKEYGGTVPA
jgi:putative RecB family exonuclease